MNTKLLKAMLCLALFVLVSFAPWDKHAEKPIQSPQYAMRVQ